MGNFPAVDTASRAVLQPSSLGTQPLSSTSHLDLIFVFYRHVSDFVAFFRVFSFIYPKGESGVSHWLASIIFWYLDKLKTELGKNRLTIADPLQARLLDLQSISFDRKGGGLFGRLSVWVAGS